MFDSNCTTYIVAINRVIVSVKKISCQINMVEFGYNMSGEAFDNPHSQAILWWSSRFQLSFINGKLTKVTMMTVNPKKTFKLSLIGFIGIYCYIADLPWNEIIASSIYCLFAIWFIIWQKLPFANQHYWTYLSQTVVVWLSSFLLLCVVHKMEVPSNFFEAITSCSVCYRTEMDKWIYSPIVM